MTGGKIHLESTDPVKIFHFIFYEELLNKIVSWVNKCALMTKGNPVPKHSSVNWWKPTTLQEIKQFLGLSVLMGNVKFPSHKCY